VRSPNSSERSLQSYMIAERAGGWYRGDRSLSLTVVKCDPAFWPKPGERVFSLARLNMRTRVLLADSQLLFRGAIRALIDSAGGYEVVGEASGGEEALVAIEELTPDLVILALSLEGVGGTELVHRARRSGSRARFLFLSDSTRRQDVEDAFKAGACGYVAKSDSTIDLLEVIEHVLSGRVYLSPDVAGQLVKIAVGHETPHGSRQQLSRREREILQLIAEGMSNKDIANLLDLSVRTIDTHRARLMEKLGIHKVSALVRYAIREGFLNA
jgi:DNA-binding NarL/FixJ family response regulator